MRSQLLLSTCLLATTSAGCGRLEDRLAETTTQNETTVEDVGAVLVDEVVHELDVLRHLLSGGGLPTLVLFLVGVGLVSVWLSRTLEAWRRRRGLAVGRLTVAMFVLQIAVALVATLVVLRYLFEAAPVLVGVALFAGAVVLTTVVGRHVPAWVGGIALVLQRHVNEGDRVRTADVDGVVERVGVLRLVLRRSDGSRTFMSVAALGRDNVTVASPQRAHAVVLRIRLDSAPTEAGLARLAAIAALCPYRAGEGDVRLSRSPDDETTVVVELRAWSADAAREAEIHLRRAMAAAFRPPR
jgi:small-conductance mechanosensitive channel